MIMVCNFMPTTQEVVVNGNMTFKDGNRDDMHACKRTSIIFIFFSLYNTHTHTHMHARPLYDRIEQNTFLPSKSSCEYGVVANVLLEFLLEFLLYYRLDLLLLLLLLE